MSVLRVFPGLHIGDLAPDFDLFDADGKRHRLEDYRRGSLVVFFYPKDNTPGCIVEACRFGDDYDRFRALGAEVLGISGDDQASHARFREGCRLRYDLLSDPVRAMRDAWKVPHFLSLWQGRCTYIVDPQGRVSFVLLQQTRAEEHPIKALAHLEKAAKA